jgi:small subunit ribosomal protein S13
MALTARALSSITAGFSGLSLERTGSSAALKSYCGLRATPVVVDRFGSSGLRQNRQVATPSRRPLGIRAARVAGVEIPNNKRIECALTYIYGVGDTTAKVILNDTGILNKRTRELSEEELSSLRAEVEKYMVEGDLRRFNSLNIKRLKDIQCYRGRRHIMNLPCRGQKTKTNARTRRGKKVAIAGKKKAPR